MLSGYFISNIVYMPMYYANINLCSISILLSYTLLSLLLCCASGAVRDAYMGSFNMCIDAFMCDTCVCATIISPIHLAGCTYANNMSVNDMLTVNMHK